MTVDASATTTDGPTIDLTDPAFYDEPLERYAWLHENAPIYRCDVRPKFAVPFWVLCKWKDIRVVGTNPELFTTTLGVHLSDAILLPDTAAGVPDDPRLAVGMKAINVYDPKEHRRVRGSINDSFRPKRAQELEPMIRSIVRRSLETLPAGETVDFVPTVGHMVPLLTVTEMLGLGAERAADFERWSRAIIMSFEPNAEPDWASVIEMFDFIEGVMDDRRREPQDDLITDFLTAEWQGQRLSNEEIIQWCWILLAGGLETTQYLLSDGLRLLLEHPDQLKLLRDEPALMPGAVAEMLRWTTPVRYMRRTATADTEVGGVPIAEGDQIMLNYAIANFDPEMFDEPSRFDITRDQSDAISFGVGPHHCIGSGVARLEARVLFEELLARFSSIELAGPAEFYASTLVNGISSLPVRCE